MKFFILFIYLIPAVLQAQIIDDEAINNTIQSYWSYKQRRVQFAERDSLRPKYIDHIKKFDTLSVNDQQKLMSELPQKFYRIKINGIETSVHMQSQEGRKIILERLEEEAKREKLRDEVFKSDEEYLKSKVSDMNEFEEIIHNIIKDKEGETFKPKWIKQLRKLLPTDTCCVCVHEENDPSGKYSNYQTESCKKFVIEKKCTKEKLIPVIWSTVSSGKEVLAFFQAENQEWQKSCHTLELAISTHGAFYGRFIEDMAEVKTLCPRTSSFCAFQAGCRTFESQPKFILETWQKVLETKKLDIPQRDQFKLIGNQCVSSGEPSTDHPTNSECIITQEGKEQRITYGACKFGKKCMKNFQQASCLENGAVVSTYCCGKEKPYLWQSKPCDL